MVRAQFSTTVLDPAGTIQTHKALQLFEDDGATPLAQPVYDAPSGGSIVGSPETDGEGQLIVYADLGQYFTYRVEGGDLEYGRLDPDPAALVMLTGPQTVDQKTLTDATLVGPTLTDEATYETLYGSGPFQAKGVASGGKGGLYVAGSGTTYIGTSANARVDAAPYGTLVVNRTGADGGSEAMLVLDWTSRARYAVAGDTGSPVTDCAGLTLTVAEGDFNESQVGGSYANPLRPAPADGPAGNILGIENRMTLAVYPGKIARGHGNTRYVLGVGLSTQTAPAVAGNGARAMEEVGLKIDCDGRSAFPPTDHTGSPATDPLGVMGGIALATMGFTGWYFHQMGLKPNGGGVTTDPLYCIDRSGWYGLNTIPQARFHLRRDPGADSSAAPLMIIEGDHSNTVPVNVVIRGAAIPARRLTLGYDTVSAFGAIDAQTVAAAGTPLLLNPSLGRVYVSDSTNAGGATGRLVVKQAADDLNNGLAVASVGAGTKTYVSIFAESGAAGMARWYTISPGETSAFFSTSSKVGQTAFRVDAVAGAAANLLELAISGGAARAAIDANGAYYYQGNRLLTSRQAAVSNVTSANATDLATVIALANEMKVRVNDLLARLRVTGGHGLIAD